jgi:L-ascorbate metabolism protein UlaG (beta-lactamase superfamily)
LNRRRLIAVPLGAVALLPVVGVGLGARFSAPRYDGPPSDHFDGAMFHNAAPIPEHGFGDFVRWRRTRPRGQWDGFTPEVVSSTVVARVAGEDLRATYVGHATVLLQTAGLNVLTDPIWSERASPVSFAGPARYAPPGIAFEDLPPIDVVLISHNHYDHLDLPTLKRLASEHEPSIYAPLGNAALLGKHGIESARDLDWWASAPLAGDVTLTCVPAQHFSGRGMFDRNQTLWGGFVLETPGGVIYFAGDTGVGPHFGELRERFGAPRLALLPVGAYLPSWFMRPVHIDPREAAEAHRILGARTSLGIHFGCFELADDPPDAPPRELAAARKELGIAAEVFRAPRVGEAFDVAR